MGLLPFPLSLGGVWWRRWWLEWTASEDDADEEKNGADEANRDDDAVEDDDEDAGETSTGESVRGGDRDASSDCGEPLRTPAP